MKLAEYTFQQCNAVFERAQFPKIDETTGTPIEGETVEGWQLVILDPAEPGRYILPFNDEVRDEFVRQLTGGVVLPGAETWLPGKA